jgi:PHS family inorganic phosphate transporter-like MFS transporter
MLLTSLPASEQKLNKNQDLCVKVAGPVGSLFGQLLFGWLADTLGRKRMCKFLAFFF